MAVCKKCKSWIVSGDTCWDCSQAKEPQMVKSHRANTPAISLGTTFASRCSRSGAREGGRLRWRFAGL